MKLSPVFSPRLSFLLAWLCLGLALHADSTAELLTQAQAAYARGDLASAKRDFQLVYQLDARNTTAINYLKLIKTQEAKQAAPLPTQEKKLAQVILPQVQLREASLESALKYLTQQTAKITDDQVKLSFVLQVPDETRNTPVTLSLSQIPLTEALRYIGELSGVAFTYEPYAIVGKPRPARSNPPAPASPQTPASPQAPTR